MVASRFFPKILTLTSLILVSACAAPYLYDSPGYDANGRPVVLPNPNMPRRSPPDYYNQRQAPYYPQQQGYYPAPQQQGYYSQQGQQGYAPQQRAYAPQQSYSATPQPASRFYNNPYDTVPQQNYYPRYDADQYYVPPTYYNSAESGSDYGTQGKY